MRIIVGLGNPGAEYATSRHNVGRMLLARIASREAIGLVENGKHNAHIGKGKIEGESVFVALPDTYMNKSGSSVKTLVTSEKQTEELVVIYDDLDLPFGTVRLAQNRGSGGHNGVESIIKALKCKAFVRIRVGVAQTTASGKIRKPKGEDAVVKFLMGDFGKKEKDALGEIEQRVYDALTLIVRDGVGAAMNLVNSQT